jgi:glycosyltransferase involved in cell wall biosynthesis
MAKFLYLTPPIGDPPVGGRALLSHLHCASLASLLGEDFILHELGPSPVGGIGRLAGALRGAIDGVSASSIADVLARIHDKGVDRVFLNGSNLGAIAKAIKKARPEVEILTFFHNVESRFFLGALREKKSLKAAGVLVSNYVAERMAVRHSDRLVVLSERDADQLGRLYGRRGTDIVPMALEDRLDARAVEHQGRQSGDAYLLFVGGAFYANQAGISWFAKNVAPRLAIKTTVVGHGMEKLRAEIGEVPNVEIIGAVDDLQDWYLDAKAAIAPIFDGSGMKTKVAEALMFGKKIAGTREAFSGYDQVAAEAGWLCKDADEFLTALACRELAETPRFDPRMRELYEAHHSPEALRRGLTKLLGRDGT